MQNEERYQCPHCLKHISKQSELMHNIHCKPMSIEQKHAEREARKQQRLIEDLKTKLTDLPQDLFFKILDMLDFKDVVPWVYVSKHINGWMLCYHPYAVWKSVSDKRSAHMATFRTAMSHNLLGQYRVDKLQSKAKEIEAKKMIKEKQEEKYFKKKQVSRGSRTMTCTSVE